MLMKTTLTIIFVLICVFKVVFFDMPYPKFNPNLQTSILGDHDDSARTNPTSILSEREKGSEVAGNADSGAKLQTSSALQAPSLRWSAIDSDETTILATAEPNRDGTAHDSAIDSMAASVLKRGNFGTEVDLLREQFDKEKLKNKELLISNVTMQDQTNHLRKTQKDLELHLRQIIDSKDEVSTHLRSAEDEISAERQSNIQLREQLKQISNDSSRSEMVRDDEKWSSRESKCIMSSLKCSGISVFSLISLPFDATGESEPVSTSVANSGTSADKAVSNTTLSALPPEATAIDVPSKLDSVCRNDAVIVPSSSGNASIAGGNPSDLITAKIVLKYARSDTSAQEQASAITTLLVEHGFQVKTLNVNEHRSHRNSVRYFYAEDRGIADEVAAILAISPAKQKPSSDSHAPPQPGVVEVDIAGIL